MATTKHEIEILTGENYYSWRRNMEYLLQSKGLWGTVTPIDQSPPPSVSHSSQILSSPSKSKGSSKGTSSTTTTTTTTVAPSTPVKQDPGKGKDRANAQDKDWFLSDNKARGLIGLYVSLDMQPIIDGQYTAHDAWW